MTTAAITCITCPDCKLGKIETFGVCNVCDLSWDDLLDADEALLALRTKHTNRRRS